jgi:5,6-dimethylbenzimidazole synthase
MKFPTPNYRGMATAPGLIVVATDFRFIRAFPVLREEDPGSEVNRPYYENAERILLQSVAAATMSAHLAAAALGYNVWWVTAIGQQHAQEAIRPLLDVPAELSILDIMCFGPPAKPIYKRWKKDLDEIMSWDRFDRANLMSDEQVEEWIKVKRHRALYRSEENVERTRSQPGDGAGEHSHHRAPARGAWAAGDQVQPGRSTADAGRADGHRSHDLSAGATGCQFGERAHAVLS